MLASASAEDFVESVELHHSFDAGSLASPLNESWILSFIFVSLRAVLAKDLLHGLGVRVDKMLFEVVQEVQDGRLHIS